MAFVRISSTNKETTINPIPSNLIASVVSREGGAVLALAPEAVLGGPRERKVVIQRFKTT